MVAKGGESHGKEQSGEDKGRSPGQAHSRGHSPPGARCSILPCILWKRRYAAFAFGTGESLQHVHPEASGMGICGGICGNVNYDFDTNAPYLHPNCTLNAPRAESWVHLSHFRSLSRVHLGLLGAPSREPHKRNAHMALRARD